METATIATTVHMIVSRLACGEDPRLEGGGRVVERADPADPEPADPQPLPRVQVRAAQREHAGDGADDEQQEGGEQPPGDPGDGEPVEGEEAAQEEDGGELRHPLQHLAAGVDAPGVLVVALAAAEGDAADEGGEEAVGVGDLRDAVDREDGPDGGPPVELHGEQAPLPQPGGDLRDRPTAGRADQDAAGDRVDDVPDEPVAEPRRRTVLGDGEAEEHEREREAVVEAGLRGEGERRLGLLLLAGRPHPEVAGQDGVGGGEGGAEHDRRARRQPHRRDPERRDRGDRDGHHHAEQDDGGAPPAPRERPVEAQPGGEQRDDHRELGEPLHHFGVADEGEPVPVEQRHPDRPDDPEPEVHHAGREGTRPLMRERHDRRHHGGAEEQQPQRPRIRRLEARRDRDRGERSGMHPTPLPARPRDDAVAGPVRPGSRGPRSHWCAPGRRSLVHVHGERPTPRRRGASNPGRRGAGDDRRTGTAGPVAPLFIWPRGGRALEPPDATGPAVFGDIQVSMRVSGVPAGPSGGWRGASCTRGRAWGRCTPSACRGLGGGLLHRPALAGVGAASGGHPPAHAPRPSRLVFLAAPSRRGGAAVGGGGGASAGHRRSPPSRAGPSRPRPAAIAGDDAPLVPRGPLARRAAPWAAGRPAAAPAGSPSSRCRPGRGSGCGGGRRGRASERRRRRGRAGPGWARSARGSRPGRPPGPPAAA